MTTRPRTDVMRRSMMTGAATFGGTRVRPAAAIDRRSGAVIARKVMVADTVLTRLVGLLGRRELAPGTALWISPCKGIHTMGMRFPIDVIFLDREMRVVAVRENVVPWRTTRVVLSSSSVLEMAAGSLARTGVAVGDQLDFVPGSRRHSHGLEE